MASSTATPHSRPTSCRLHGHAPCPIDIAISTRFQSVDVAVVRVTSVPLGCCGPRLIYAHSLCGMTCSKLSARQPMALVWIKDATYHDGLSMRRCSADVPRSDCSVMFHQALVAYAARANEDTADTTHNTEV